MAMTFVLGAVCGWGLTLLGSHPGQAAFGVTMTLIALVLVSAMFWRSRGLMFLPPRPKPSDQG